MGVEFLPNTSLACFSSPILLFVVVHKRNVNTFCVDDISFLLGKIPMNGGDKNFAKKKTFFEKAEILLLGISFESCAKANIECASLR